jgi:ribonuclease P protein component
LAILIGRMCGQRSEIANEENLSTKQYQAQTDAWISHPNGNPGRAQCAEATTRQGTQEAYGDRAAEASQNLERMTLAVGAGFPKKARLRKRPEFIDLSRSGKKHHTANFVVITKETGRCEVRLGMTVSSKVGNAVVRNRVKRLLRESFRRLRVDIVPTRDILIIAKKGAASLSLFQLARELRECLIERRGHRQ